MDPALDRPLYVADCLANKTDLLSSEENGEPLASLWRKNLCGRLGPVFPSSAVQTGRYPGTRMSVDPAYKVARSGARAAETRWTGRPPRALAPPSPYLPVVWS